jgi:eukaryotic-like serine/threonine-protein kinase
MAHQDAVWAVAFSPDGQTILTGSDDKTARLWDATTGQPRGRPLAHQGGVKAVAFSPDGQTIVTGGWGDAARLWDAASARPLGTPLEHPGVGTPLEHPNVVQAVAFSPDGRTILTGGWDNTARLWDAASGQPRGRLMAHQGPVMAVAFSPDGSTILTGSYDTTAQLWDAATARPLGKPLVHQGPVYAAAFSPDGQTALTGGDDKTARLWSIPSPVRGDVGRIRLWVQVLTGVELDEQGDYRVLDAATWQERRDLLRRRGGPPGSCPDPRPRLQPIRPPRG